jgi:hypothetical protein
MIFANNILQLSNQGGPRKLQLIIKSYNLSAICLNWYFIYKLICSQLFSPYSSIAVKLLISYCCSEVIFLKHTTWWHTLLTDIINKRKMRMNTEQKLHFCKFVQVIIIVGLWTFKMETTNTILEFCVTKCWKIYKLCLSHICLKRKLRIEW